MTLQLPALTWRTSPNYSSRGGQKVRLVVAHDCEGSFGGSVSWFAQAVSQVSAHIVLSDDGSQAVQMVSWANKAWHVCDFNPYSEGIEAAGYASKGLNAPEWQALANIVAYRLKANNIPCQRATSANNWVGYCEHVDLGAAGGGHHDITSDPAIQAKFDTLIHGAYAQDMPEGWQVSLTAVSASKPVGWTPSGTTRHDLIVGSLEWVQMRLNALGMATPLLKIDGLDGPATDAAIAKFQINRHLFVDGTAGPQTIAALRAAS